MVLPLIQITMNVFLRDGDLIRSEDLTFSLLRHPSNYDIIIGRLGISVFLKIPSTGHGMVKFLTERGIAMLKPSKESFLICSIEEEIKALPSPILELSINPKYPE